VLAVITDHLEYLRQKAIANSRSKKAYRMLGGGNAGKVDCTQTVDSSPVNNQKKDDKEGQQKWRGKY
jgi:hypothetical protein